MLNKLRKLIKLIIVLGLSLYVYVNFITILKHDYQVRHLLLDCERINKFPCELKAVIK